MDKDKRLWLHFQFSAHSLSYFSIRAKSINRDAIWNQYGVRVVIERLEGACDLFSDGDWHERADPKPERQEAHATARTHAHLMRCHTVERVDTHRRAVFHRQYKSVNDSAQMRVNNRRSILFEKRVQLRVLNPVKAFLGYF
jgi:hypothetical protein